MTSYDYTAAFRSELLKVDSVLQGNANRFKSPAEHPSLMATMAPAVMAQRVRATRVALLIALGALDAMDAELAKTREEA